MSKTITRDQIEQVKTAARRLQKSLPGAKLQKCQDIAAYQFLGVANFHEALALAKATAAPTEATPEVSARQPGSPDTEKYPWRQKRKITQAEHTGLVPYHSVGDWNYFAEDRALSFDGEYLPYVIGLDRITTANQLLHLTLQLAKKRWPRQEAADNGISTHYQIQEFLELLNDLCEAYLETTVQGAFTAHGKPQVVNWAAAIEQRGEEALTAQVAKRAAFNHRFGL